MGTFKWQEQWRLPENRLWLALKETKNRLVQLGEDQDCPGGKKDCLLCEITDLLEEFRFAEQNTPENRIPLDLVELPDTRVPKDAGINWVAHYRIVGLVRKVPWFADERGVLYCSYGALRAAGWDFSDDFGGSEPPVGDVYEIAQYPASYSPERGFYL